LAVSRQILSFPLRLSVSFCFCKEAPGPPATPEPPKGSKLHIWGAGSSWASGDSWASERLKVTHLGGWQLLGLLRRLLSLRKAQSYTFGGLAAPGPPPAAPEPPKGSKLHIWGAGSSWASGGDSWASERLKVTHLGGWRLLGLRRLRHHPRPVEAWNIERNWMNS